MAILKITDKTSKAILFTKKITTCDLESFTYKF